MAWIQYSKFIKVTSGALLFAVAMAPIGIYITVQNLADTKSGLEERKRISQLVNSEVPSLTSEGVGPHMIWSVLYDDALVEARIMVTNDNDNSKHIWWLCDSVSNGFDIVNADSEWYLYGVSTNTFYQYSVSYGYKMTTESNVTENANVSASITTNDNYTYTPYVASPKHYLAIDVYDYYGEGGDISGSDSIFDGDDNFWTWVGNGSNVYKYGCEKWFNIDTYTVSVSQVYGTVHGLTVDKSEVEIPAIGTPQEITVTDDGTYADELGATLLKLTNPDKDDSWVIAYSEPIGIGANVVFDRYFNTVTESVTTQVAFNIKIAGAILSDLTMLISSPYTDTIDSVYPTELTFTSANWNDYQTVYVNTGIDAQTTDRGGIIRITYVSVASYLHYFPLEILNSSGDESGNIIADPVLLDVGNSSSAISSISISNQPLPTVLQSKYSSASNLNECNNILSNLQSTILVGDSYFSTSNRVQKLSSGSTNGTHDILSGESVYTIANAVSAINSFATPIVSWSISGSFHENSDLISIIADYKITDYKDYLPPPDDSTLDEHSSIIDASLSMRQYDYEGVELSYPSIWALSNGYVKSVSVYASFRSKYVVRLNNNLTTNISSYAADTSEPNKYESHLLNIVDAVRARPANISWQTETSFNHVIFPTTGRFIDCPLVEIFSTNITGEVSDYISFDVNISNLTNLTLSAGDYQIMSYDQSYDLGQVETWEYDYGKFYQTLSVDKLFTVVEWNWEHFNTNSTWVATNYVPDWITSNTNSP